MPSSKPRLVAVPQAVRRQPVLDRQPAGQRRVAGGLLAAARAVTGLVVGDGPPVEPQPDRVPARWGDHGRQIVLDTSPVKMFLPSITDVTTLDAAAKLCGQASWKVRGQDHATRHDVATPDMIRQLPAGFALVIRGGCAPVIARLPHAWKNPAYRLGHLPTEPTAESTPYPVFVPQQRGIPDHVPAEWTPGDGPSHPWN